MPNIDFRSLTKGEREREKTAPSPAYKRTQEGSFVADEFQGLYVLGNRPEPSSIVRFLNVYVKQ